MRVMSPYGKLQHFLTVRGKTKIVRNDKEKEVFDWGSALADSAILAGLAFCTALVGINAAGIELSKACTAALLSAGGQFFSVLALKRKLTPVKQGE